MSSGLRPFHLAFVVTDLNAAIQFYSHVLGFPKGRSSDAWCDFDCFGHQIVAHLDPKAPKPSSNNVDGDQVPVPHFGVILDVDDFKSLSARLQARPDIQWIVEPRVRFQGQVGQQHTMFFLDPSGNALEFKAFANDKSIFATG